MTEPNENYSLGIEQIKDFMPHRFPMLLIDRILQIEPKGNLDSPGADPDKIGTRVVALKNVTYNEPFFQGHFPSLSLMPGVMLIEAMAQTTSFTLYPHFLRSSQTIGADFQCVLVGVDDARFRRPVVPGDTLKIESVLSKVRSGLWFFNCKVEVDGQEVASAEIMAKLLLKGEVK